jgi:type IV pilus assembly protein PilZ
MSSSDQLGEPGAPFRVHERTPFQLRVAYERMNSFFADYTKNISKGGTFIKTERSVPLGTKFLFSLSIPSLPQPVQLLGEVAWFLGPDEAVQQSTEPGMGIRFLFDGPEQRLQFESMVEALMRESLGEALTASLLQGSPPE